MKEVSNRLGFPQMEEEILEFWRNENIFQKSIDQRPEDKAAGRGAVHTCSCGQCDFSTVKEGRTEA